MTVARYISTLVAPTEGAALEETALVWYILTGDHLRLDDKMFEVLDKNLVPLGNEVGFCLNLKEENSAERSWQLFHWNDDVTRIYY